MTAWLDRWGTRRREAGRELGRGMKTQSSAVTSHHSDWDISETTHWVGLLAESKCVLFGASCHTYIHRSLFGHKRRRHNNFTCKSDNRICRQLYSHCRFLSYMATCIIRHYPDQTRPWLPHHYLTVSRNQVTRIGALSHESSHKKEGNCSLNVKPP